MLTRPVYLHCLKGRPQSLRVGLVGAKVKVTLEIEAEIPDGAPDHVVRVVTENSQTLKFTSHGFEEE